MSDIDKDSLEYRVSYWIGKEIAKLAFVALAGYVLLSAGGVL